MGGVKGFGWRSLYFQWHRCCDWRSEDPPIIIGGWAEDVELIRLVFPDVAGKGDKLVAKGTVAIRALDPEKDDDPDGNERSAGSRILRC